MRDRPDQQSGSSNRDGVVPSSSNVWSINCGVDQWCFSSPHVSAGYLNSSSISSLIPWLERRVPCSSFEVTEMYFSFWSGGFVADYPPYLRWLWWLRSGLLGSDIQICKLCWWVNWENFLVPRVSFSAAYALVPLLSEHLEPLRRDFPWVYQEKGFVWRTVQMLICIWRSSSWLYQG